MSDETRHLDDDLMIGLVHGLLPEESIRRARKHLEDCVECEQTFLQESARYEARRASGGASVVVPLARRRVSSRARRFGWVGLLAAAASLAVVVWQPWASREPEYWISPMSSVVELRSPSELTDLNDALDAYEARDLDRAVALLDRNVGWGDFDGVRRLYLASVLIHRGDTERGLQELDALGVETLPFPWGDEAELTRAMALLRLGRDEEGRSVLERLATREGPVGETARGWMDQ